jgi:hypothetical protein
MTRILKPDDFRNLPAPLRLDAPAPGGPVPVEFAVESLSLLPPHRFREEPFSVILVGPPSPLLPQATYALVHPRLGTLDVFLVPVARGASDARYEVIFN